MKITKFAIDRPITTTMLFLGLVIFGFMAYSKLAVNLFPDLKLPVITINTFHFGATPEEIEKEITNTLEKEVATLSGLKELKSYSQPDASTITIQFQPGVSPDEALNQVKTKVEAMVTFLPKEAEKPLVQKFKLSDTPVIDLIVSSNELSANALYDYTNKTIKNQISRLEGVSRVYLDGGEEREIKILANQRTLLDLNIGLSDISEYLKTTDKKTSGGNYHYKDRVSSVEVGKKFQSVTDISSTPVATPYGTRFLKDIAQVKDTIKTIKTKSLFFDVSGKKHYNNIVSIAIMKTADANSVQVARAAKKLVAELKPTLPPNIQLSIPFDSSEYIQSAVDDAIMNIVLGIIITGFVLFFFLNDVRTTLVVSISIPVSLLGTFLAINFFGGSLNMMTLMSFSVAIGALVSNSIVVVENIIRLRDDGTPIKEAALQGTSEVMMAIVASTGTNLVVFLPIAMMSSVTGAFFKEYAITIASATIFSLIVSFMLTPMLASVLLKKQRKPGKLARLSIRFFHWLENQYEKSLTRLMSRKIYPLLLFTVMFIIFIATTRLLSVIGFEFLPQEDNSEVYVEMEMPAGTSIQKSEQLITQVEKIIGSYKEVKSVLTVIGKKNEITQGSNYASNKVKLVAKDQRSFSSARFASLLEQQLAKIPEIKSTVSSVSSSDGAPIQFMLKSDNTQALNKATRLINKKLKKVDGLLNFESSLKSGNPLIRFQPNNRLLATLNLNPLQVALTIRNAINGVKVSVLKENSREYDIRLSYPNDQINSVKKIKQIPVFTPQGSYSIGALAQVFYEESPAQIQHDFKTQTVEFVGNLTPEALQGEVQKNIEQIISNTELPSSVKFSWSGNVKELEEANQDMMVTFMIAFLLMYMLLASLLESFWQPLVVFTTVPMAMIGVFVLMYMAGITMNIMSLMAIITLLGLVVNDDILIHDYTEHLMHHKKMDLYSATILAGKTKMKTVIMTTVAIIFGMLPNALGFGDAGAESRTPMAIVTIGGMITSTVLTLYLIPSIFYVIRGRKKK